MYPDQLPVNYQVLSGLPMQTAQQQNTQNPNSTTNQPQGTNPAGTDVNGNPIALRGQDPSITYCQTHPSKKIKFYCKND